MATDKEQRTIEIILKAQEANASLKEMGAGAAVMSAQLKKMGQDDPGRAKLENDLRGLNQRLTEARASTRGLTEAQQAQSAELVRVIVNGQKVAASYNEIEAAAKRLEAELKDLPAGTEAFIKKSKELDAVKDRMEEVNEEMAGSQKSALLAALGLEGITSASGLMRAGFQAAMSALLPLLAVEQIWEWVKAFAGVVQEVDEVRAAVNTATGAQGEMLDTLTARTRALSMSFGVEYADALKGVDVLAKQMGLSHEQAFDLMEKGYVVGANRSEVGVSYGTGIPR
jgi:chromosome segregation ATPase